MSGHSAEKDARRLACDGSRYCAADAHWHGRFAASATCSHGESEGDCPSCAACAACRGECGICPYVTPPGVDQ